MTYWPDGTPRSTGNAFDWRGQASKIGNTTAFKNSQRASQTMAGKGSNFTIKQKPKAAK